MEWIGMNRRIPEFLKKYRYLALLLLTGIFLMTLPSQPDTPQETSQIVPETEENLQVSLEELLTQVQGAGKVRVLLTQARGEQVVYQTDADVSPEKERRDTVLVTNSQREETGLIRQVIPPIYQGAIVVCQGADNANVRLALVEAVRSVTGLTSDHITILKMK